MGEWELSTAAKRSFGRAHNNAIGPPCSIRVFAWIYEYRDRFSDRFITASVRHNGIQIRAVG
jgi:hypothetical protein